MNKYKWFSESMTSTEARVKLFTITEGKTGDEKAEINAEYEKVLPIIIENELKHAAKGWLL